MASVAAACPREVRALSTAGLDRGLPMHLSVAIPEANAPNRPTDRRCRRRAGRQADRVSWSRVQSRHGRRPLISSVWLTARLLDGGVELRPRDPAAGANARKVLPDLEVVPTVQEAPRRADVAVIATKWSIYRDLDWASLRETMQHPLIIDGRRPLAQTHAHGVGPHRRAGSGRSPADRSPVHARSWRPSPNAERSHGGLAEGRSAYLRQCATVVVAPVETSTSGSAAISAMRAARPSTYVRLP